MITVIGEALIDLVPTPDSTTLRAVPGGTALNVAVGAARLGHPTALMARLSSDYFGQILRRHAARNGVDLGAAAEADEPTTLAAATPAATPGAASRTRARLYLQGTADWQWSAAELARIPVATTILHLGSLACCVAPGAARILKAAAIQRRNGALVCLDPDVCPDVLGTPARGRLLVERMVMSADVVKASTEDIAWLYPGRALEDAAAHWLRLGPELVVITCGGDGAMALRGTRTVLHRPAYPARVVDTSGAGDAFTAALLGGLGQLSQASAGLRALSGQDLARLLDICAVAAGLTCERTGTDLPTRTELRHALRSHSGAEIVCRPRILASASGPCLLTEH
ncbi:MAG: fructokinase [Streptosporangiaceae bacterium]|jgi:fructokinase|nr:fructokinase [Streptosporangiaceae bacterium]